MPPKKQTQSTPTPKATRASTASAVKPATTTPNQSPVTKSTPTPSTQGKKRKAVSTKQDTDDSTPITVPTPAKKAKATKTQPQVVEEKTAPTTTSAASKPTPSKKKSTTTATAAPVTASPTPTSTSTSTSASASKSKSKATPKAKAKAKAKATPAPKSASVSASASKTKAAPSKPAPVAAAAAAAADDDDQDEDQDMTPTPAPASKPAKKTDTRTMQQKIQQRAMQLDDDSDDTDDESDDYSDLDMNSDGEFPLDSEHIRALDQMEQKINANLAKAQAVTHKKPSSKNAPAADEKRGVIYLGHIPYGFFEDQMSGFFSQFGTVTRLRLARNKKTGRSKHYAFIEFESDEVADIVASSMNNYMMFGHTLVCERVPADRVHPNTFDGANTKFHVIPWQRIARQQHNKDRTAKEHQKRVKRLVKKESAKHAELKALGIDYAYTGYAEQLPAKPTRKTLV